MARVVDTNVAIAANGAAPQADARCVQAAARALREVEENHIVVIDDDHRILREYRRHLSPSGQPGPGDRFFAWLWNVHADPRRCEQVPLTCLSADENDFAEFPEDPQLAGFDRADRKFLCVALKSSLQPVVLNATDTRSWPVYEEALRRYGLRVEMLCPQLHGKD
jgi:hypothetical protein